MSVTPVVLGIDPQASRLGLALVEFEAPHRALWADTVSIDRVDGGWRYQQIRAELFKLNAWGDPLMRRPTVEVVRVGIEDPPYVGNPERYKELQRVVNAVDTESHREWPWAPHIMANVSTWKQKVLDNGKAPKTQVWAWAADRLGYTGPVKGLSQDSADALAIATYAAGVELSAPAEEAA